MKSKFSFIILLYCFSIVIQIVYTAHPSYPVQFPSDIAYISQSTSCFTDDLETWTCPPCEKTINSYRLLNQYSLSGIDQYIFVDPIYQNIIVAYRYSYSKEMKFETLCDRSTEVFYTVSSKTDGINPPCITNAEFYVSSYMNDILISSSTTIVTLLDLFYQRIEQVIEAYPHQRNDLIFTGYEIGGSIAQVVNSL